MTAGMAAFRFRKCQNQNKSERAAAPKPVHLLRFTIISKVLLTGGGLELRPSFPLAHGHFRVSWGEKLDRAWGLLTGAGPSHTAMIGRHPPRSISAFVGWGSSRRRVPRHGRSQSSYSWLPRPADLVPSWYPRCIRFAATVLNRPANRSLKVRRSRPPSSP